MPAHTHAKWRVSHCLPAEWSLVARSADWEQFWSLIFGMLVVLALITKHLDRNLLQSEHSPVQVVRSSGFPLCSYTTCLHLLPICQCWVRSTVTSWLARRSPKRFSLLNLPVYSSLLRFSVTASGRWSDPIHYPLHISLICMQPFSHGICIPSCVF